MSERVRRDDYASWKAAAPAWERQRDLIAVVGAPVTARLVELLDPQPGEAILEVACGNGEVGLAVAALLGDGLLIQSDFVPGMVDAARREAERLDIQGIEHRVLDATNLDVATGSLDGIVCRWGYMLLPEPAAGLMEAVRVLRPGGRVSLAVWAESDRNPWATVVGRTLVSMGLLEPPDPEAPGPFRLGDRARLLQTVHSAGLEVVVDEEVAVTWRAPSPASFWDSTLDLSITLREWVGQVTEVELTEIRRRVEASLTTYATADGLSLPGVSRVVLAVKPAR